MSIKKIAAIGIIYLIGWAGWWTLGTITALRSNNTSYILGQRVASMWGRSLYQKAPSFSVKIPGTDRVKYIIPESTEIDLDIQADYRKKGLIVYSTYNSFFNGNYKIKNDEKVSQKIYLHFSFPSKGATYDEFGIYLGDDLLLSQVDTENGIDEIIELAPNEEINFRINYKTRGIDKWKYIMAENTGRVKNFSLTASVNFEDVDYTPQSISPMSVINLKNGRKLIWKASDLITNGNIGIIIPEKINPGPLTTRITYFAPVCLFFFFILTAALAIVYKIDIHPMHYLFVAAGFFAFHLLLSYLAGHVKIHLAFFISGVVSVSLVTYYLFTALGPDFPWKAAVAGQCFFLILFSYSFFIKGITGIIVATGSVVTLAILMKVTADIDWDKVFENKKKKNKPKIELPEDLHVS